MPQKVCEKDDWNDEVLISAFVLELITAFAEPLESCVLTAVAFVVVVIGLPSPEPSPLLKLVVRVSAVKLVPSPASSVMSSLPTTPVSVALPEDKFVLAPSVVAVAP